MRRTRDSLGFESESWKGALDLRWIPDPALSFFMKYRHNELDKDNPDEVVVNGLVHSNTYSVRSPVSTQTDLFSLFINSMSCLGEAAGADPLSIYMGPQ